MRYDNKSPSLSFLSEITVYRIRMLKIKKYSIAIATGAFI